MWILIETESDKMYGIDGAGPAPSLYTKYYCAWQFDILIAERISERQPNPGCIFAICVYTCPSRLGMSNVTLRNVKSLRLGM